MVAAAAILVLAGACRTWKGQPLPAATPAPQQLAGHVRVTRVDGSREELADARLESDTLRGERWRIGRRGERPAINVPVDSVQRLEARSVSAGRTIALVAGLLALGLALGALVTAATVVDY